MLHLIWQLSTCQKTRPWHVTFCSRPNCSSHSSNNTAFAAASEDWASCSISLCFDGVGVYRCEKAKQTEEQKMVKTPARYITLHTCIEKVNVQRSETLAV